MASGITLQSTNNSVVTLKNVGTTTGTTEVTVPNRNMTMGTEITLGTAQATTSGTFKDFTIPSGVKRITVMFNGVSTNGTSNVIVQLGTSSGITTSGYSGGGFNQIGTFAAYPNGFGSINARLATNVDDARYNINLMDSSNHTWSCENSITNVISSNGARGNGNKTLSAELTTVRITTVNGTDTFDAGSVNVSWEF